MKQAYAFLAISLALLSGLVVLKFREFHLVQALTVERRDKELAQSDVVSLTMERDQLIAQLLTKPTEIYLPCVAYAEEKRELPKFGDGLRVHAAGY